jgi:hypothetical protein
LLGGQDAGGGEEVGSGHRVHARTVGSTQRRRLADAVVCPSQGHRSSQQHLLDEQLHQLINLVGIDFGSPDLALCFGADMPALPGRAVGFHRRQDLLSGRGHPLRVHGRVRRGGRIEGLLDHGLDRVRSADRFDGFRMPGGALLG